MWKDDPSARERCMRAAAGRAQARVLSIITAMALAASACTSGADDLADAARETTTSPSSTAPGDTEPMEEETEASTEEEGTDDSADTAGSGRAPVVPLYPVVDGRPQVRSSWPIAEALSWTLDALEIAATSEEEVAMRFSPVFLSSVPADQIVGSINSVGSQVSGFDIIEVVFLTPISARVMIGDPAASEGYLIDLLVSHSTGQIIQATLNPFPYDDGSTYVQDRTIGFEAAVDRLGDTASDVGVVVAAIDGGSCQPLAGHNADVPLATGSNFKGWVLGALADAIERGVLALDTPVVVTETERAPGSFTDDIAAGTELTLLDAAVLMMGNSDNTMTDHLHELVGREAVETFVAESGHSEPGLLIPFVSVNEWDNLIFSISNQEATAYLAGSDDEQRAFLESEIVPMGSGRQGGFANYLETLPLSWYASPLDLCRLMARLAQFEPGTDARTLIDEAYGAGGGLVGVRRHWDRTWYKGGSIPTSDGSGLDVLTHGWMVEGDLGTYAIVVFSNGGPVDEFDSVSIAQRLHRMLRDGSL